MLLTIACLMLPNAPAPLFKERHLVGTWVVKYHHEDERHIPPSNYELKLYTNGNYERVAIDSINRYVYKGTWRCEDDKLVIDNKSRWIKLPVRFSSAFVANCSLYGEPYKVTVIKR